MGAPRWARTTRELGHIALVAARVVKLRHEAAVGDGRMRADTVARVTVGRDEIFDRGEALFDHRPRERARVEACRISNASERQRATTTAATTYSRLTAGFELVEMREVL